MGRKDKGFSLIEVIVAVGIMTIIMGAAIPVVSTAVERNKKKETRTELNALQIATEGYFEDQWSFPADLNDLWLKPSGITGWVGPYLSPPLSVNTSSLPDLSKDAWNQDYLLTLSGQSNLEIRSLGPDGTANNSDDLYVGVDVTPIRRSQTLEELAILNTLITAYNQLYIAVDPLPADWSGILSKLVGAGFLPAGLTDIATDGWGSDYTPDPAGQTPVVRVTSVNL